MNLEREVVDTVVMLDSLGLGIGSEAFVMYVETLGKEVWPRTIRVKRSLLAFNEADKARGARGAPWGPEMDRLGRVADDTTLAASAEIDEVWRGLLVRLSELVAGAERRA